MDRPPVNTVSFLPLAAAELDAFFEQSRGDFVEGQVAAGEDRGEVEAKADAFQAKILAGGRLHSDHHIGQLVVGGEVVGHLWVARDDGQTWYVWDVAITPAHRGRGLGRAAMELASEMARADGAVAIGLSVLATNDAACTLYRSIGYVEVERGGHLLRMRKKF